MVIAYADDVTIFAMSLHDIPIIQDALNHYTEASRAKINYGKSRALALGTWDTTIRIMGIPYHTEMKILRFHITTMVNASGKMSWSKVTARIRAHARDTYQRELSLDNRIRYVHDYLMAKAWYIAQIFPPPDDCVKQLNTTLSWFIWKGDIFRVPLSTLQRRKGAEGWGLINLQAKCLALFIHRIRTQGQQTGTITTEWLKKWNLIKQSTNPPFRERISAALDYLQSLATESAYVALQGNTETQKAYKRCIYDTMWSIHGAPGGEREMRITRLWPKANWEAVWKNLSKAPVQDSV
jgi:hypothetical protein